VFRECFVNIGRCDPNVNASTATSEQFEEIVRQLHRALEGEREHQAWELLIRTMERDVDDIEMARTRLTDCLIELNR
jgi:uncharacterized protein Yka (UPF0111/DUF47 family)